nr:outer membrane lipoprotein LolB [Variovorax terrae]
MLLIAILFIAGCAHPTRTSGLNDAENPVWSGRLALQVDSEPPQSFSAGFELRGNAGAGELALFSPLGSTLAVLAWAPGSATLRDDKGTRSFDSLDALVAQATGTPLPIAALFDWLQGRDTPVPGWQADLSRRADGRLAARRTEPAPTAQLRLALDR